MAMTIPGRVSVSSIVAVLLTASLIQAKGPRIADPRQVDADYAIQGEYSGTLETRDGARKMGVQVIALGDGRFRVVKHLGGLPGDGWDQNERSVAESQLVDGAVTIQAPRHVAVIRDGQIEIADKSGRLCGHLKRVVRKGPTLGAGPPEGAVVLFDGTSVDAWDGARRGPARMSDGLLHQGVNSKQRFQNHTIHIEFRLPYQPQDRGQARGNSGIYPQGRYEVQMLDSFGLDGKDNECGGIYEIRDPDLNMCFPPLQWQTYDIDFTAAEFDDKGQKLKNARITVRHNGVLIHEDIELPRATRAAPLGEGPAPGFIHLQNHGNPLRYRNIWVVERQ